MVLNVPAERLRPGGRSHHLLEQLYRCHILSESAERQWGTCRVISAPGPGHLKSLLLVGIPYMVRRPSALQSLSLRQGPCLMILPAVE